MDILLLLPKSLLVVAVAVGIASILAVVLFPSLSHASTKEPFVKVAIDGLKETYKAGEPVDFVVTVEGYGCDRGFPTVSIIKVDSSNNQTQNVVWSRMGEIRLFAAGSVCESTDFYKERHIGDIQKYNSDEQERSRTDGKVPITLGEGRYTAMVESIVPTTTKDFSVVSAG
jgi:hypothetical protein